MTTNNTWQTSAPWQPPAFPSLHGRSQHAQVIETALGLSAGLRPDLLAASLPVAVRERVMNDASSGLYRGFGLHALMDAVIHAAGRTHTGSRKSPEFVREAHEANRQLQASHGATTLSLSGILGNAAQKALIQSYQAQATTWREIAAVPSHSDFKPTTRYRLDVTGAFRKVGPDGELKHVGLSEDGYSSQLDTFGATVSLTRQMQINDDLGAFTEIPTGLGRMSAVRIEEAVYVTLLSNPGNFFHADKGNLLTGGDSALSEASLTAAETAFSNRVDRNGKPIFVSPNRLLVGTALGVTATRLYTDTTLIAIGMGNAPATVTSQNPHEKKFKPVVTPYLNNTLIRDQDGVALSGQSATQWYLFADPAVLAAVAVAFLNGQEVPTIQSTDTEFTTLGMQWRAFHDFTVGMEDTAAATKSAGA